jgi:SAM-dependent methyltransferase
MAATRRYYDRKADPETSKFLKSCLTVRQASKTIELRIFHNDIKRHLLKSFCKPGENLLDLGCGRGGDLQKWNAVGLGSVLAVDLSPEEIQEAQTRRSNVQGETRVEFRVLDLAASAQKLSDTPYDIVSCMFAIQYFFCDSSTLDAFFQTVSDNLKEGGYFIGTCPDGDGIDAFLGRRKIIECPSFKIQRTSDNKVVFQIRDTVTDEGVQECLVHRVRFLDAAERHGLRPFRSDAFKKFNPGNHIKNPDLWMASSLFMSFAFVKC